MRIPLCTIIVVFSFATRSTVCNDRPIIGILTQEFYYWPNMPADRSYIAASYVKSIEASGGRVVPVFTNRTAEYYEEMANKVNGMLVPGGGSLFNMSFGIAGSTSEIFRIAKRMNNAKDHFPILGICLGFELLLIASNDGKYCLTKCNSQDVNLPLNLLPEVEDKSVLFKAMPESVRSTLLTEPVTANHHNKCMTNDNFTALQLDEFWNAITVNEDSNNLTFISIVEAKNHPIVGLQFHPEKNAYEWERNDPHSWSAVYSARYFYDWFVNECRKNEHGYSNKSALNDELIYNYSTAYVGKLNDTFEQVYFFYE